MISQVYHKLKETGFGHLFGSSVLNKVLGLLSSVVIVRLISKSDYGIYANANNILSLFCIFEAMGMTTTLLQYGSTSEGQHKQQIWSFCFYCSLAFQVLLCMAIALCGVFTDFSIAGTGSLLAAMALLPLFRCVRDMQTIYMRTDLKMKEFALSNNFNTIMTVAFSIALSFLFQVKGLITASYIAIIASCIFIAKYQKIHFPKFDWSLPGKEKIELIKFSLISALTNSISLIVYLLDTFVLGIIVAQSTVTASYKVALTIPTALAFIPMCVMTYIYPHFAKRASDSRWCLKRVKQIYLLFGAANVIISGILILLAPWYTQLIFGAQYLDAIPAMRILLCNYFVSATFFTVSGQLLVSLKKIKFNLAVSSVVCILNLALNTMLIPEFGAEGAAGATLLSSCISAACSTFFLLHCYKSPKI